MLRHKKRINLPLRNWRRFRLQKCWLADWIAYVDNKINSGSQADCLHLMSMTLALPAHTHIIVGNIAGQTVVAFLEVF